MKHSSKLPSHDTPLAMAPRKCSHTIAKVPRKPPIKIVHVLAPEIIKTDARHFRDLVQRLTGKPVPSAAVEEAAASPDSCGTVSVEVVVAEDTAVKAEVMEETESLSGGLLSALGVEDEDVFFKGVGDQFPLPSFSSWNMDAFSF